MKQKNLILMVVAVGCGLGAAVLTAQMSGKGKVDEVNVLVAGKNLTTGTFLTKDVVEKSVKPQKVPKGSLTHEVVVDPDALIGKRLARSMREGDLFNPADLKTGSSVVFVDGKHIYELTIHSNEFVCPGSRVDVLAHLKLGESIRSFPLLVNMQVIGVNGQLDITVKQNFPDMRTVQFAVNQKEAELFGLARLRGCTLELLLRNEQMPIPPHNMDEVLSLLQKGPPGVALHGDDERGGPKGPEKKGPEPKTVEPPKPETTTVLIAKETISPETLITDEFIAKYLVKKELPSEFAKEACNEATLKNFVSQNKVLKTGLVKDQWVTTSMIGEPKLSPKPPPQDDRVENEPKPAPKTESKVEPKIVVKGEVKFRDIAFHTATGTMYARYAIFPSGEQKLWQYLTPQQAAANPPEKEQQPGDGGVPQLVNPVEELQKELEKERQKSKDLEKKLDPNGKAE